MEIERIKNVSNNYIQGLDEVEYSDVRESFRNWLDMAIPINEKIHQDTLFPFLQMMSKNYGGQGIVQKYKCTLYGMNHLFENSQILTQEPILLKRQTNFPDTLHPVYTSATDRLDFNLIFGSKTYYLLIPSGTPIFYISVFDENEGMPREETEQEFILYPGTTQLNPHNPEILDYLPYEGTLKDYVSGLFRS